MQKKRGSKERDEGAPAPELFEVLGVVRRVITRPTTPEDQRTIDTVVHRALDAVREVDAQLERAKKATGKLKQRRNELDAYVEHLHEEWGKPEVEEIVECEVVRTTTEIRLLRVDTRSLIYNRALTKEEHQALGARLPGMTDDAPVRHPELDQADDVARYEERKNAHLSEHARLTKIFTFEEAIAAADEGEKDKRPKAEKKGRKGKKKMKQEELFASSSETEDSDV